MIVRDEEDVLARCLDSARGLVDEMIVVDTGSSDATPAVAVASGARVVWSEWTDDFSAARNVSLRHATGDWILVLDADEWLAPESPDRIRQAIEEHGRDAVAFQIPVVNDFGNGNKIAALIARLFRNVTGVAFENRVHEQVLPSLIAYGRGRGLRVVDLDAPILHDGYRPARVESREKNLRNRRLFELQLMERPDDLYSWFKYADFLRRIEDPAPAHGSYRIAYRLLRRRGPDEARCIPYASEIAARWALDFLIEGRIARAYAVARRASERYQPTAHLWLTLGAAASELDRHEEAVLAFGRCVACAAEVAVIPAQPGVESEARRRLATSLVALDRKTEAETVLRAALEKDPGDGSAAEALASLQAERGDLTATFRTLTEILRLQPSRTTTWLLGGRLLVRSGVPALRDRGESWLERVVAAPNAGALGVEARRALGEARLRAGELDKAREHWSRHPDDVACVAGCRLVAYVLGDAGVQVLDPAETAAMDVWISAAAAPESDREAWRRAWLPKGRTNEPAI